MAISNTYGYTDSYTESDWALFDFNSLMPSLEEAYFDDDKSNTEYRELNEAYNISTNAYYNNGLVTTTTTTTTTTTQPPKEADFQGCVRKIIELIAIPADQQEPTNHIKNLLARLPQLERKPCFFNNYMYNFNELLKRLLLIWIRFGDNNPHGTTATAYLEQCRVTLGSLDDISRIDLSALTQKAYLDRKFVRQLQDPNCGNLFKRLVAVYVAAQRGKSCDGWLEYKLPHDPELSRQFDLRNKFFQPIFDNNSQNEIYCELTPIFWGNLATTVEMVLPVDF